jgi:hypothetical protein
MSNNYMKVKVVLERMEVNIWEWIKMGESECNVDLSHSKMEQLTLDSGSITREMVTVINYGLMALDMRDTGAMIKQTVRVSLFTQTEIFTRVNG